MCGRFGLYAPKREVEDRFDAAFLFEYHPQYNIAPEGGGVATITNEAPGAIDRFQWGLLPRWVDDPADFPTLINARGETVSEKASFRDAFRTRRCLVPANNFYEWTGSRGSRVPYWIGIEREELFAMAGIWETWSANGEEIQTVAIITTAANDVVGELHDRMPVILDRDEEQRWLEADDSEELQALLDPYPAGGTKRHEVSKAVNNPENEGPELVEPVGRGQSGLGDFSASE